MAARPAVGVQDAPAADRPAAQGPHHGRAVGPLPPDHLPPAQGSHAHTATHARSHRPARRHRPTTRRPAAPTHEGSAAPRHAELGLGTSGNLPRSPRPAAGARRPAHRLRPPGLTPRPRPAHRTPRSTGGGTSRGQDPPPHSQGRGHRPSSPPPPCRGRSRPHRPRRRQPLGLSWQDAPGGVCWGSWPVWVPPRGPGRPRVTHKRYDKREARRAGALGGVSWPQVVWWQRVVHRWFR